MELKHLRTFLAVRQHRSFTRASQSLGLTQAAVSQHIAQLESELGAVLFDRGPRKVELTKAGHRLHEYASRILDLVAEAEDSIKQASKAVSGTLRIAASTIPAEALVPALLAEFHRNFPEVREEITVSDSRAAAAAVAAGEADVAFVGEPCNLPNLACNPLADDELVLVVSKDHPLAKRTSISLKQLKGLEFAIREPGSGSRTCLEQALAEHDMSLGDLRIVMESNSNETIRAAVERDSGAAFLSTITVDQELAAGDLVALKVRSLRLRRQLYLVHSEHPATTEPLRTFLSFLKDR